jgi:hypothetical protein
MKKIVTFILLVLVCICGYAQTIDPVLLEEMGQRRDNEKIKVFVIMRQQYDQQQLNRRASHFTTRDARREFVVNELKQFAEATQYDLRHSLAEMQRNDLVSQPKTLWIANAIYFEATRNAILSLADRSDIMVIGFDEERNWIPDGEETQPADPTREITSNVTQVNANQVWNLGYTGQGVSWLSSTRVSTTTTWTLPTTSGTAAWSFPTMAMMSTTMTTIPWMTIAMEHTAQEPYVAMARLAHKRAWHQMRP